jgi:nucleotide-binding universal stress UspA family protein
MPGFHRILVATDGSPICDSAIDRAVELSSCLDAELLVLSVAPGSEVGSADLESASDPLGAAEEATMAVATRHSPPAVEDADTKASAAAARCRAAGVAARPLVWQGPTGDAIIEAAAAERADLIVVGSHCRGGVGRLLMGSVSDHVLRHAEIPVMVVRPESDSEA